MEWTREQRYLPYEKHSALELLKLQAQAANSSYQMHYHVRPSSGLLNDPNGFSYYNNEWHVFYQSFPFGAAHGLKSWMHMTSPDLVHWQNHGLALAPDTEYDSHGAYSGSARVIDDRLFLMYTGNHRDADWQRTPYQLGAWLDKQNQVTKLDQPLFVNPDHISEHFRDPQLLKHNDKYYAIIGAQEKGTQEGHIDLWVSDELTTGWQEVGYVDCMADSMGYMCECPNLIEVDGHPVLIFCPQGLDKKVADYKNIYPNMYLTGDDFDYEKAKLINSSQIPVNLDDGFDVYATQAFNAPDGKAYAISWVGLPDLSYPTDTENWANCLSQVKELHYQNGRLLQKPVAAMKELRGQAESFNGNVSHIKTGRQFEMIVDIAADQAGTLFLAAAQDLSAGLQVRFDTRTGKLSVDRSHAGQPVAPDFGTVRSVKLPADQPLKLDVFIDHSLAEIFVNDGEHVLTMRFFNDPCQVWAGFDERINAHGTVWQLKNM